MQRIRKRLAVTALKSAKVILIQMSQEMHLNFRILTVRLKSVNIMITANAMQVRSV